MASTEHDHSKCKKAAPYELSLNDKHGWKLRIDGLPGPR